MIYVIWFDFQVELLNSVYVGDIEQYLSLYFRAHLNGTSTWSMTISHVYLSKTCLNLAVGINTYRISIVMCIRCLSFKCKKICNSLLSFWWHIYQLKKTNIITDIGRIYCYESCGNLKQISEYHTWSRSQDTNQKQNGIQLLTQ